MSDNLTNSSEDNGGKINSLLSVDSLSNLSLESFIAKCKSAGLKENSHITKVSDGTVAEADSLEDIAISIGYVNKDDPSKRNLGLEYDKMTTIDTENKMEKNVDINLQGAGNFYKLAFSSQKAETRSALLYKTLNIPSPSATRTHMNENAFSLFDRYYSINPDLELSGLCHYIFMTRPDLYILDDNQSPPIPRSEVTAATNAFNTVFLTNPNVVKSLTNIGPDGGKSPKGKHSFIPIITSRVDSIQLPDYSIRSYTIEQPYSGYTMPIATHGNHSITGGQFDLVLRETYDLAIHKMFQLWTKYISDISIGAYSPRPHNMLNNICDYAVSVYDIICAPDAKTILYWVKYVGAFPNIAPISDLSFNKGSNASNQVSITFDYFLSEQMDVYSLIDFNINAGVYDIESVKDKASADIMGNSIKNLLLNEKDGFTSDKIDEELSRSASGEIDPYVVPVYGTGDSLYAFPFIKFNWSESNAAKCFPTLEWKKYYKSGEETNGATTTVTA